MHVFVQKEEEEKKEEAEPEIETVFIDTVENYIAGLPNDEHTKWVGLQKDQIRAEMGRRGVVASPYLVSRFLYKHNFKKRSNLKNLSAKEVDDRDFQFCKIQNLKEEFAELGLPVVSIDTKNKEALGLFDRNSQYFGKDKREVNDHDFMTLAEGIVIPHGIYDIFMNKAYLSLGCSKDTSEFACDNIIWAWQNHLQWQYPEAESILILCDGGGSNSSRHYIFKYDIWRVSQQLGINIIVAHYPPYCSKWNPIEHRYFCHLHRAWNGAVFTDMELVKALAEKTTTSTGLKNYVRVNEKEYETGRKAEQYFRDNINDFVVFDDQLPAYNYGFYVK